MESGDSDWGWLGQNHECVKKFNCLWANSVVLNTHKFTLTFINKSVIVIHDATTL